VFIFNIERKRMAMKWEEGKLNGQKNEKSKFVISLNQQKVNSKLPRTAHNGIKYFFTIIVCLLVGSSAR
jgi:hypothetical protein